ncbi:HU family DNA-binding protein [uncultured Bacteroides sp.]|uniref:HU family DNA-binding protein n=1 Tax=uncultured Bacteroides sp. TaxID=162156 RepID=UPI002AAB1F93|nr:HU family DNA-binding protein [uncultured Bacteroides sp.]
MGERINIQNLIDLLAAKKGISKKDAETFLKEMFAIIEQALQTDKYVKIKGLGTFKLIDVDSRESVNVNTGERIEIQGHTKISFTPEAGIRDLINKPFAHFETVILNEGVVFDDVSSADLNSDNEDESENYVEENTISEKTKSVIEEAISPVIQIPSESITKDSEINEEEESFDVEELVGSSEQDLSIPEPAIDKTEDSKIIDGVRDSFDDSIAKVTEITAPTIELTEEEIKCSPQKTEQKPFVEDNKVTENAQPIVASVETNAQVLKDTPSVKDQQQPKDEEMVIEEPVKNQKLLIEELISAAETEKKVQDYSGGRYSIVYFISMLLFLVVFVSAIFVFIYNPDYILNMLPESSENKVDSVMVDANKEKVDSFALTHPAPARSREEIKRDLTRIDSISALASGTNNEKKNKQEADNKQKSGDIKKTALEKKDPNDYKIVGTIEAYTVKKGESIVRISQHYYNSKDLWTLIVKHNSATITNPDNVPAGTVIKIPKLSSK